VFVVSFVTHLLLLLAVSAERNLDRSAYATSFYWLYACGFYAAAIAGSFAWLTREIRLRTEQLALAAVGLAAPVLGARTFRHDPAVGIAGVVGGAAAASMAGREWPRSAVGLARRWLADDRVVVVAAFLLALAVRLLYARRVMSDPNYLETG